MSRDKQYLYSTSKKMFRNSILTLTSFESSSCILNFNTDQYCTQIIVRTIYSCSKHNKNKLEDKKGMEAFIIGFKPICDMSGSVISGFLVNKPR